MLYNLTTLLGILFFCIILRIAIKHLYGKQLLKLLSIILVLFKTTEYISANISGRFAFPIEISTISYFIFSFVFIFDIKKGYHIASFFGMISGIGFFLFYTCFGFLIPHPFNTFSHLVSIYAHGVLLIGGAYLFFKHSFAHFNKRDLLIVMLFILCHASIFYIDSHANTTFIYYLVKTDYLPRLNNLWVNHIIKIIFYKVLFISYLLTVNLFFYYNKQLHLNYYRELN